MKGLRFYNKINSDESIRILSDVFMEDEFYKLGHITKMHHTPTIVYVYDEQTPEQEQLGELKTVFKDGVLVKEATLAEIRERVNKHFK